MSVMIPTSHNKSLFFIYIYMYINITSRKLAHFLYEQLQKFMLCVQLPDPCPVFCSSHFHHCVVSIFQSF